MRHFQQVNVNVASQDADFVGTMTKRNSKWFASNGEDAIQTKTSSRPTLKRLPTSYIAANLNTVENDANLLIWKTVENVDAVTWW